MNPDPYLRLTDPAISVNGLQDGNFKKISFFSKVSCLLLYEATFTSCFKSFSYYFSLMIEGSGAEPYLVLTDPDRGGSKTYGSKRIQIRISDNDQV
jgi:hypothetical protein